MSNLGYFNQYNRIFGWTGTLGNEMEIEFLHDEYKADTKVIPRHKQLLRQNLGIEVYADFNEWHNVVISELKSKIDSGRAVLLVYETLQDVNDIYKFLSAHKSEFGYNNLYRYTDGDPLPGMLQVGDIVISTNLAGRGMDLKIDRIVNKNGGLHTLATYLPDNMRTGAQVEGRICACW